MDGDCEGGVCPPHDAESCCGFFLLLSPVPASRPIFLVRESPRELLNPAPLACPAEGDEDHSWSSALSTERERGPGKGQQDTLVQPWEGQPPSPPHTL